jgi:hypothetical protein
MLPVVDPVPAAASQQKLLTGYVERVRIDPGGLALRAKIDTGATHSSLDAKSVEKFTRDAQPWLRFSVTNETNRTVVIERPVYRIARIRQHGGGIQKRDVLMLGVCLGTVYKTVEVNLIDRAGFDFRMLIGRSFLGTDFLVDPSESFLLEPSCPEDVK